MSGMTSPAAGAIEPVSRAARRRAREEISGAIVEAARRRLATEGAAALSLRAVARDLGMVSSAVYRYVAGRDELLTLLILDGYNALGAAVEQAEGAVPRADRLGRWLAIGHGVRDWALAHPHEYALLYGSPVPGYVAPEATVPAATRVTALLGALLEDVVAADPGLVSRLLAERLGPLGPQVSVAMRPTRPFVPEEVPDELLIRGLAAWTYLFGAVSFELFGHRQHVIDDDPALRRAFFAEEMLRSARTVGISPSS
jgi:AcrR family transcriptional regulator